MSRPAGRVMKLFLALCLLTGTGCSPATGIQSTPGTATPLPTAETQVDATPLPRISPVDAPTAEAHTPSAASPEPTLTAQEPDTAPTVVDATPQALCEKDGCAYPGHFFLQIPAADAVPHWVDPTYRFGSTAGGTRQPHTGVEFQAPAGSAILAAADGRVAAAGESPALPFPGKPEEYGNLVVLEHHFPGLDPPVYSLYGHLASVAVQPGQEVKAGDRLGSEGATGIATGPHLHFEVRVGSGDEATLQNPELWLEPAARPDGQVGGALAGRITTLDSQSSPSQSVAVQYTGETGKSVQRQITLETYAASSMPGDDLWKENFAAGDLAPGWYRVTFAGSGKLYERRVRVYPGMVTIVDEIQEIR